VIIITFIFFDRYPHTFFPESWLSSLKDKKIIKKYKKIGCHIFLVFMFNLWWHRWIPKNFVCFFIFFCDLLYYSDCIGLCSQKLNTLNKSPNLILRWFQKNMFFYICHVNKTVTNTKLYLVRFTIKINSISQDSIT